MTRLRFIGLMCASALVAVGCATLASPAGDDDAVRPNAHAGPFRKLAAGELPESIKKVPFVLNDGTGHIRQASAVDLDGNGSLGRVAVYAVADLKPGTGIYRFISTDGRSFDRNPDPATPILVASETWEGSSVGNPDVHLVDGKFWMLYDADGGIGLARSDDGVSFTRDPGPVLGPDASAGWEGGKAPGAPALLQVSAAAYQLFYGVNDRIGEARSKDGITWTRSAGGPLLAPLGGSGENAPFDSDSVGDPYAVMATSAEGRRITRVYYAGVGGPDGIAGIGLAARFGVDGPLSRADAPVWTAPFGARSPSVLPFKRFALLYSVQIVGTAPNNYPAVALGIAPGNASIPMP